VPLHVLDSILNNDFELVKQLPREIKFDNQALDPQLEHKLDLFYTQNNFLADCKKKLVMFKKEMQNKYRFAVKQPKEIKTNQEDFELSDFESNISSPLTTDSEESFEFGWKETAKELLNSSAGVNSQAQF
jgi:hypothetical protein